MRRLARRLFTLCSALSLLLCVAVCVLWVRSYSRITTVVLLHAESHVYAVAMARGGVYLMRVHGSPDVIPRRVIDMPIEDAAVGEVSCRFAGFGYEPRSRGFEAWLVPFWFAALSLLAVPAAVGWRIYRRAPYARTGRCPACGYDLRASPGRCPECGTIPEVIT